MLQERSPAHRAEEGDQGAPGHVDTLVTALAVGLVVALAVLGAFALNYAVQRNDPPATRATGGTAAGPATGSGTGGTPTAGARGSSAPTAPAAKQTTPPGSAVRPGQPAKGAQLWAKAPLNNIHQDQGSSIALPDGRTLWIFADTFQLYTQPKFFITSSAGLTTRNSWQLSYSQSKGIPTEFLPRTPAERADNQAGDHYQAVWPTGSTELPDGRIIISYAKYRVLVKTQDFQFLGAGPFE